MIFIGVVFYLGTIVSRKYKVPSDKVFMSIWILFSCAMGAGSSMSNVPSVKRAKECAGKIFEITDEPSTLDIRDQAAELEKEVVDGRIEFKDVAFKYPSRTTRVLEDFNMVIPASYKIALVGHSGCGKSTITNLLLRFYHIHSGEILIDGKPI
jgi:ABC-type multidrug transport system fused ATPase/permease subunit